MEVKVPRAGDPTVEQLASLEDLGSVLRALLTARQLPVELGQTFKLEFNVPRVGHVAVLVTDAGTGIDRVARYLTPRSAPTIFPRGFCGITTGATN
jgi:hypothetical protein